MRQKQGKKKLIIKRMSFFILALFFCASLFTNISNIVAAQNNVFKIVDVSMDKSSPNVVGDITNITDHEIKSDVTFHELDSSATYKINLKNDSEKDLVITSITDDNSNEYVVYDYDKHENAEIKARESFNFDVKSVYKNELTDIAQRNQENTVNFTINYTEKTNDEDSGNDNEGSKEKSETVVINPRTEDSSINIAFVTMIVSAIGMIICVITKREKNNKVVSVLLIAIIASLTTVPITTKAISDNNAVTISSNIGLYDKLVVTYSIDGEEKTLVTPYGGVIEGLEDPTKDGYDFDKWTLEDGSDFDITKPLTEDIKLIAKFNAKTYTITYDLDGGTVDNPTSYTIEDEIVLNKPSKTGYNFVGWTGSNGETPQTDVTIARGTTGNLSYKANYEAKQYTITYDLGGGEANNPTSYTIEDEISLSQPTKNGYDFVGWTGSNGETPQTDVTIARGTTGNLNYKANYSAKTYTITYDLDGGTVDNPTSYTIEDEIVLNKPSKTGYNFVGWTGSNGETPQIDVTIARGTTGNLSYKANYEARDDIEYKVIHKYKNLDDTYDVEEETKTGVADTTVRPAVKSRTGFIDPEPQSLEIKPDGTSSIEYIYNRETYELVINHSEDVEGTAPGEYPFETPITLRAKDKEGFTFTKWSNNQTTKEISFELVENTTIEPIYTRNSYNITYEYFEDSANKTVDLPTTSSAEFESNVNVANKLELAGYTFDGWYKGSNIVESFPMPAEAVTLKGRFVANTDTEYKVEHYTENLDGSWKLEETENSSGTTGEEITAGIKTYGGFEYDEDNEENVPSGTIAGDGSLVLKRYYKRQTFTVAFDSQGGQSVESVTRKYQEPIGELAQLTKKHANFIGWFTASEDGDLVNSDTIITKNITFYAQWSNIMLCKKATSLHSDICERTTSGSEGCYENGYHEDGSKGTRTIVYGSIPGNDDMEKGDAYDCDVNGDGVYNPENERFYYLRTQNNNAILIFYSNFQGEEGIKTTDNYHYNDTFSMLPTFEQWSNLDTGYYDNNRAARLPQVADIIAACGVSPDSEAKLRTCDYVLENTSYRIENTSIVRTGIWVERDAETNHIYRIQSKTLLFASTTTDHNNVVRPVIEVPISLMDDSDAEPITHTISFDSQGGSEISPIEVIDGDIIKELPTPTKEQHRFLGWYTDTTYTEPLTVSTIIHGDATYYAKWEFIQAAALMNGEYYSTLKAAIDDAPTNGTKTTIKVLDDISTERDISLHNGNNIVLNIGDHTLTPPTSNMFIVTDGSTLEVSGGKIYSHANSGNINVDEGGTLIVSGCEIENTGGKQAIYNVGGTVVISDGSLIKNSSTVRAALHNHHVDGGACGIVRVIDGTIISKNFSAILNEECDVLVIGEEDGTSDINTPIIMGKPYGIESVTEFSFYDGIIKGVTAAVNDENLISDHEDNTEKQNDTEVIDSRTYHRLYYVNTTPKFKITFNPNGGTIEHHTKSIEQGANVGELPVPTNGAYTFDGWYTDLSFTDQIDENVIPVSDTTYYAKWSFVPSHKEFNIINDAMTVYYNNISLWKSNEGEFQSNMDANFETYGCQVCNSNYQDCPATGSVLCDKSKGFKTGVDGEVNVYLSDEETKTKGDLVTYTTSSDGTIYNMIPGETYYWESSDDSNIYGTVKVTGNRRIINTSVRNVRDLGGMKVDVNGDGTSDGSLKYGKLFRGVKLSSSASDVDNLEKLGITEEVDLRAASDGASDAKISNYQNRQITNYEIDKENYPSNYTTLRNALIATMEDIINGENIYFHCKIGTDRTGTLAYFLEGLLGVSEEERLEDYELSYFYGLLNRHRFYSYQAGSSITHRFTYMHDLYPTNEKIYDWFMQGSTDTAADNQLINNFRSAMIKYN